MSGWDAIVIGAGHNGLAAARMLGEAGKRVLVLDKAMQIGGMTADVELAPSCRCPRFAHLLHGPSACLATTAPVPTVSLAPDGRHVVVTADAVRFVDGAVHPEEAAYLELRRCLLRFAGALAPLMNAPPPTLGRGGWRQADQLGRLLLRLRQLGKPDLREFLRVALSNVHDLIGDELADGPLAGAMALDSVLGAHAGPRSPGTVMGLLYRYAQGGEHRLPIGGMGALPAAMAAAAQRVGVEMRTGSPVEAILVEGDRVAGVRLVGGDTFRAEQVLSSLDVRTTTMLAGVRHFDVEMVRRVRNHRAKGVTAKLNLALAGRPSFPGLDDRLHQGRIVLAPSLSRVEQAFDRVKYGGIADVPVMELVLPDVSRGSSAGGGGRVLSAIVQYVPHGVVGAEMRAQVTEAVLAALEAHAPGLRRSIVAQEFLMPVDIERLTGCSHWHHGEMALDQLLMNRPVSGMGDYGTGLTGLTLCGAGSHPGGDVTMAPGRNAAATVLRAMRS